MAFDELRTNLVSGICFGCLQRKILDPSGKALEKTSKEPGHPCAIDAYERTILAEIQNPEPCASRKIFRSLSLERESFGSPRVTSRLLGANER